MIEKKWKVSRSTAVVFLAIFVGIEVGLLAWSSYDRAARLEQLHKDIAELEKEMEMIQQEIGRLKNTSL